LQFAKDDLYLPRVQSVNTAPKLQKRLEVTMRNIKRRKIEGYETVENIKSIDPLLYSKLTHQKNIRIK